MIKILYLIPTLDRSGAEKQLTLLATHLPTDEFNLTVAILTHSGPYKEVLTQNHIRTIHLQKRWKFDPVACGRLRSLIKKEKPDILHTWMFTANAYGRLAVRRHHRPKVIISERRVNRWKSGWQHKVDRRLLSRTDCLIGNSQSVVDFYRKRNVPEELLRTIPNAVEPATEKTPQFREKLLAECNLPADAILVGFAGRLVSQKRVHDLIWGFQVLRQLVENVYFLIVGDGPERHRLEKLPANFDCNRLVRFLGHREDAREIVSHLDVFWLGSDFEGMSDSVMEAMAAGVPVVASDIPPNRELVVEGESGFLAPVGEGKKFAQITARLLQDKPMQQKLSEAGRKRMQANFSVETMVESHVKLYREILERFL